MKYPKEIYVVKEAAGTEDEYLHAAEKLRDHADLSEDVKVARYVLQEIVVLTAIVKTR